MELKFRYTPELLESCLFHQAKKTRKICVRWFFGMLILGIVLVVADLLWESATTAYAGVFFLTLAFIWALSLNQNKRSKLRQTAEQRFNLDPNKTVAFRFEDAAMYITINGDSERVEARMRYELIQTVAQIDNTKGYLITKSNVIYPLQCDSGISGVVAFLREKSEKTKP